MRAMSTVIDAVLATHPQAIHIVSCVRDLHVLHRYFAVTTMQPEYIQNSFKFCDF